ncbi:AmmeMemoRadiSam system protein B [Opitutus sp. ER46]|uniref:AmmeMemoRadiSam system protein B n=1 Tax=Opitutus sp. ER46 TaxID=2161864 RepID=UPI000D2FC431|nr:AmmeMemoRadiSam system protein B [Opitutus sp. ER46]PTX92573.1 hypothetical protein DB354_14690 [Opitutus sp. ER46]
MKRSPCPVLAFALACAVTVFATPPSASEVREPAVAGLFYPKDPGVLGRTVDAYLAAAKTSPTGELRALICPHAGYDYSGPVAASGFALLRGSSFATVVLLSPAHYAAIDFAAVSDADIYRTPLGDVPVAPQARELARHAPFALDHPLDVQRPPWADQASRPLPRPGEDQADTWEHSGEVEVPFLQRSLGSFQLLPVVMGRVDPAAAARALDRFVDDRTLLVVSTDLSHYHSAAQARRLDRRWVDAVLALDLRQLATQEACGLVPVQTLVHLARQRGWEARLLDLRNSGDTAGDSSRVVGYAAVAFYARPAGATLNAEERSLLLALARRTVVATAGNEELPAPGELANRPSLTASRAVFVTLTRHGQLRGCIGNLLARGPLYAAVIDNARSAAREDPRFSPVRPAEVAGLEIEISVLSAPLPLPFTSPDDLLRQLRPGVDGVILRVPAGTATYLPQVWQQLPDKTEFLDTLAQKAGGRAGDWRRPGVEVAVYQVASFREHEP